MPEPVVAFVLTPHAKSQLRRRSLDEAVIRQVLAAPEQRETLRPGRDVLQSLLTVEGRCYLVRVFVDVDRTPAEVVPVYRTSKVQKYGRSVP